MQKKRSLGLCRFQKFQEASLLSSAELQSGVMQHCNIAHSFQRCSASGIWVRFSKQLKTIRSLCSKELQYCPYHNGSSLRADKFMSP